jgi:acetyltransferase-like isoleucine patch superfamily enzyme
MKFKRLLINLRDLPKSFVINMSLFPVSTALKFPIWAKYDTRIIGKLKKGTVIIEGPVSSKMVTIGIYGSPGVSNGKRTTIMISDKARVVFQGQVQICESCLVRADGGEIVFGNKFSVNSNSIIWGNKRIIFGNDVIIGYDVYIRDSDGHFLLDENMRKSNSSEIIVSDHVWICAYAKIGKGAVIEKDAVVAMNSVVVGYVSHNSIVGGIPAKVIKTGMNWQI